MASTNYTYELRREREIIATGHATYDQQLQVGDQLTIGKHKGTIQAIEPISGSTERRLVVQVHEPR